jgi:3-dehydroquinate synthase
MAAIKIQKAPTFSKATLKKYSRVAVLVDENTRQHCYELVRGKLPDHRVIQVPAGESHKTLYTCQHIWQGLTDYHLDRHSLLLIIGGGVLGDMGGFCAATFKRGIDFMLMPTTLLAQVDASVGGKLGVDFGPYKNHIGVFQAPVGTLIATDFLKTLPERELRSGFAEVIKHCLIADRRMWDFIRRRSMIHQDWVSLVKHSVKIKSVVTRKDPKEKGLRKILNFGHTIGHAIEGNSLASGNHLFHGEAIAAGMVLESFIALKKKLLKVKDLESITSYILSVFGKIEIPVDKAWLRIMAQDKKNKGNTILMALPRGIGKATWDVPVSEKDILGSLEYYAGCQI